MTSTVQDAQDAPSPALPPTRARRFAPRLVVGEHGFGWLLRRNWLFAVFLFLGATLRAMAWVAYQPALLYIDSFRYLDNLDALAPNQLDPIGYDLVLRGLLPLGGLRVVSAVQLLAGLGMAVAVYALLRRYGTRRWLAAIGVLPLLLDAYQVQIEENVMSDLWLEVLLVAALWVLLSRGVPTPKRVGWAGFLLALATIMRTIALPLALPIAVFLIVVGGSWRRRAEWRTVFIRLGAFALGLGFPLLCYASYFYAYSGTWGLSGSSGNVLFGRAAEVVDCPTMKWPDYLKVLCPDVPYDQRMGVDWYAHLDGSGAWPPSIPAGMTVAQLQHQFGMAVIEQQPGRVLHSILIDFGKSFAPGKNDTAATADTPVYRWQFQTSYPLFEDSQDTWRYTMVYSDTPPSVNLQLATVLRDYQMNGGYTQGPILAVFAVLGLLGGFGLTRRARRSGIRSAALLVTAVGVGLLFFSDAYEFSWRYQLPGLVLLPLGGVLGLTALLGPLRRPEPARTRRTRLSNFPDQVDWEAITEFTARHGEPRFAPVLVVIAAYNEEGGIGGVLDNLPARCCDLDVDVLVVVDGCTDGTAAEALKHGAYVCQAPTNRGQGAALRLGYQLAGYGGARYVITTDADGQYRNEEMPLLLRPLLEDEADFVTGSRRLGVEDTDDRVRSVGVRFFATLASVLTLRKITDTSFGFRAMRTELAGSVRLRQPQYQASELMLGALAGGARLREVPMTMRTRTAGSTKKGNNFVYGCNYAKVMTWTWLREFVLLRLLRLVRPRSTRRLAAEPVNPPSVESQEPDSATRT